MRTMDVLIPQNIPINKNYSEFGRKKITELYGLFLEKNLSYAIKLVSEVSIPKAESYYFIQM